MKSAPDAYALALAQERQSWIALHDLQRGDPGYAAALSRWRDAADSISIAMEQLVKKSPRLSLLGSQSSRAPAKMPSREGYPCETRDADA